MNLHTDALSEEVQEIFLNEGVDSEILRLADYKIALGVSGDMGEGDEWPKVFEKVMAADILIIGTPL